MLKAPLYGYRANATRQTLHAQLIVGNSCGDAAPAALVSQGILQELNAD
jgi:hypothetical protein